MTNEMRKLHLALKSQRPEKQSPAFVQFSNDIRAGNDYELDAMGGFLEDIAKHEQNRMLVPSVETARLGAETRTAYFKGRFDNLSVEEQAKVRGMIEERIRSLEFIVNADDTATTFDERSKSKKKLIALKHLMRTFGES